MFTPGARAAAAIAGVLLGVAGIEHPVGTTRLLTRSEQGRAIQLIERGVPGSAVRVLVVGCIHGDERAGVAIVRQLERLRPPSHSILLLIPNLNPDGAAAGTRGDARGVDLNRNFPYRWKALTGVYDSGPRPLSERESRAAYSLIRRMQPTISIWFHQHERVVDASGGNVGVERRFARLVDLPLRRLTRYPGSVVGWENHVLRGSTAFVVELPAGSLNPVDVSRYARAVLALTRG